jgi:hypothetical protein
MSHRDDHTGGLPGSPTPLSDAQPALALRAVSPTDGDVKGVGPVARSAGASGREAAAKGKLRDA